MVLPDFSNFFAYLSESLELSLSDTAYRLGRRDRIGQQADLEVSLLVEKLAAR